MHDYPVGRFDIYSEKLPLQGTDPQLSICIKVRVSNMVIKIYASTTVITQGRLDGAAVFMESMQGYGFSHIHVWNARNKLEFFFHTIE
jgi:hypothetical protein